MYVFLCKKMIKDKYCYDIYFMGCTITIFVTKEEYDNCKYKLGDLIPDDKIEMNFFKKGFDIVCTFKFK